MVVLPRLTMNHRSRTASNSPPKTDIPCGLEKHGLRYFQSYGAIAEPLFTKPPKAQIVTTVLLK